MPMVRNGKKNIEVLVVDLFLIVTEYEAYLAMLPYMPPFALRGFAFINTGLVDRGCHSNASLT